MKTQFRNHYNADAKTLKYHARSPRRSAWTRTAPVLLLMIAFNAASIAEASSAHFRKRATFVLNENRPANALGKYSASLRATADCSCEARKNNSFITPQPQPTWTLATGFPRTLLGTCPATVAHANAEAEAWFQAGIPYRVGNLDYLDLAFEFPLTANADACPRGASSAGAFGRGDVNINTGRRRTVEYDDLLDLEFKPKVKNYYELNLQNLPSGGLKKSTVCMRDPINVKYIEEETGVVVEDTLMTFDIDAEGVAEATLDFTCEPDSEGLFLSAAPDGGSHVSFDINFPSDWLTESPGACSASIFNGEFEATGALAGLPWEFIYDGNDAVTGARLPAPYVPQLDMEGNPPIDSFTVGNTISSYAKMSLDGLVEESCLPEPASLVLLALGGLILRRRVV